MATFATVDEYISSFPPDVQEKLQAVRAAMHVSAPGTDEAISYGIPTLTLNGNYVIYFAGWKRYISVYPLPHGDDSLAREIAPFKAAKGTLRFPLDRDIPTELIGRVAARLLDERRAKERP